MALGLLTFRGSAFRYNPQKLTLYAEKRLWQDVLPDGRVWTTEVGRKPLIVEGEGVLFGPDRGEALGNLLQLFSQKASGMLQLPGMQPVTAFFSDLEVEATAGLPLWRYRFQFTEDCSTGSALLQTSQGSSYVVQKGDTLPLIAAKLGTTVESLCAANPRAADGIELQEGMVLWLS